MDFDIKFLSFFVIQVQGNGDQANKSFQKFATLDDEMYEESALKSFLDGELMKIVKRKVERHPSSEQVPTKIGHFVLEPGYDLASNPNYNMFHRIRTADTLETFSAASSEMVQAYIETSAIRGGAFITISAKLNKYFDEPFCFILKCDFEQKVARITDEKTLINQIEMAITTKNMKSIQYPYMPEEGMLEEAELKIHQSSHARYFEDFLKYVEYEKPMPEIVKEQVLGMVREHIVETYTEESEEREQFESEMEIWASSPKRELQERFSTSEVVEAAAQIIEHSPEIELKMKLDHIQVNGLLSDFGEMVHITKVNGRYVTIIESDSILFEKGFSPIEFLKPDDLHQCIDQITKKQKR